MRSIETLRKDSKTSSTFSRSKISQSNIYGKSRKAIPSVKPANSILYQRQNIRIIDDDVDVTPKILTHQVYHGIEEKQLTAFDMMGLGQGSSNTQLFGSGSSTGGLKMHSSITIKSSSVFEAQPMDEVNAGSLLSCTVSDQHIDNERAPSSFYLPRYDSSILHIPPPKVLISLKEIETFFIFEMPQLTDDLRTPEGVAIKDANEQYEYITVGAGSNRKLATAETQTYCVHSKQRGTYLGRHKRRNQGTYLTNWVMYDTFQALDFSQVEENIVIYTDEAIRQALQKQASPMKLLPISGTLDQVTVEEQLRHIYECTKFMDMVMVLERILSGNEYIAAQKRFKGLIKQDPCALDLEFNYTLDLLWTHICPLVQGQPVAAFRWNYVNGNILAAGYGPFPGAEVHTGRVLIWNIKNPEQPDRNYEFDSPVSDLDWSHDRPNFLAIGFWDGCIKVLDVSNKKPNIMRYSRRLTSPTYSPHWQVQWWAGEEQLNYEELVYTSNQDGRILCYRADKDFSSTEIMRITKIEGKIRGIKQSSRCTVYDIPISRNPGALLLRRHPDLGPIYFVGSEEGCVHRCSKHYPHQHIESFLAHDGPIYSMQFSPFCKMLFLTCGADWCTRIWVDGIMEPLITLSTQMACVQGAAWSPSVSTVIASIVNNEICLWDIKRKTYTPVSVTTTPSTDRLVLLEFSENGNQLVVADTEGCIYVYNLEGIPFPPYNQIQLLVNSVEKALITKQSLLKKLRKLGPPWALPET